MTEAEARDWIAERFGADRVALLDRFAIIIAEENGRQNLIAPSTLATLWVRHMLDSAQLVPLGGEGRWLDIGTGGGFPGLVVAVLRSDQVLLVEPRRRRAAFLEECVTALGLTDRVRVLACKVERIGVQADIISARAVAPVEKILHAAFTCAKIGTRWLLPRGRLAAGELDALRRNWGGMFHVEQSITEPDSTILRIDRVTRR